MKRTTLDKLNLGFCRLGIAGRAPKAPGTWGTAFACLLAPFIYLPFNIYIRTFILVTIFILGGIAAGQAEKILNKTDPGEVVIDELDGVWLAMAPFAFSLEMVISAFVFFRIFDILKPWPVKSSENWLPGGFGIMIDDILAGFYAMICLGLFHVFGIFNLELI